MKTMFYGATLLFACHTNAFSYNSEIAKSQTDASGKITVSVFTRSSGSYANNFRDHGVEVGDEYVAVGGGVLASNDGSGALITASYPNDNLSAWLVSTKDHVDAHAHQIVGYAIGLKIEGLSRKELLNHIDVNTGTSSRMAYPEASQSVNPGFRLIGGGMNVKWRGAGNLAIASFPENDSTWKARGKEHISPSPASVKVYAIGLRESIPDIGKIDISIVKSVRSHVAAHPSAGVNVADGYALTGGGAKTLPKNRAGSLLWKMVPYTTGSQHGFEVSSKDHKDSCPASIIAYAIGIKLVE